MKNIYVGTDIAQGGSGNRSVELKLCLSVAVIPVCHETVIDHRAVRSKVFLDLSMRSCLPGILVHLELCCPETEA